jgi:hypothetical protein
MKWERNEAGEYDLWQGQNDLLAKITPKREPGKRPRCWQLEKVANTRTGLGSNGIITEVELQNIGTFPTLRQAKEVFQWTLLPGYGKPIPR